MQRMSLKVTAIPAESVRQIGPAKAEVDSVDTPCVTYHLDFRQSRFLCLDLGPDSSSQEQESPETQAQEPSVPESTATISSPTSHDEESLASKGVQARQITHFLKGLSYKFVSEK